MTRLIVDPSMRAKLVSTKHPLELCDNSGRVLGHFIPALDLSLPQQLEPQITEEEIQRREAQGGGRPLAAIVADLEKRA